jgi:hypothetical protein
MGVVTVYVLWYPPVIGAFASVAVIGGSMTSVVPFSRCTVRAVSGVVESTTTDRSPTLVAGLPADTTVMVSVAA